MDRRRVLAGLGTGMMLTMHQPAIAQLVAAKQTRFVVGYPAAGVADLTMRIVVEGMRPSGAPSIVENRPGGGGNIALEFVARQPGDSGVYGVFANSLVSTNPIVPQLASRTTDPTRDVVPVAGLVDLVTGFAVSVNLGVSNITEFIAKGKAPGQRLRIGIAGVGTSHHLSALLLERSTGLDLTLVPYKGGAPMIADAAGGHIDAVFTSLPIGAPMVAAGKLRWIGVTQPTSVPSLPGVPSLVEVFRGMTIPSWIGVWAPTGASADVLNAMHAALTASVNSPAVSSKLRESGLEPLNLGRTETFKRVDDEVKVMKDFLGKIKVEFQN